MLRRTLPAITSLLLALACTSEQGERDTKDAGRTAVPAPPASAAPAPPASEVLATEGADASHALFGCLEGDSAVYSSAGVDGTGRKVHLWQAGDGIDGSSEPVDDAGAPVPIGAVRLTAADSLVLDLPQTPDGSATVRFEGRVACDSLWGSERLGTSEEGRRASYHRVR